MRILKSNPILGLVNSYMIDSPQPANISYMWNFGSLLGICLVIQILTGVFLAMHYCGNVELAFASVEHIMRDVNSGWFLRYVHANVASFFFTFLYLHTARGLYYSSYRTPRVLLWSIGVIILILTIATAFLGYEHSPKWFIFTNYIKCHVSPLLLNVVYTKASSFFHFIITKDSCLDCPFYFIAPLISTYSYSLKKFLVYLEVRDINPIFVYENLDSLEVRKNILEDLKNLSGIYLILNKITSDFYIGSAASQKGQNRFNSRLTNHLLYSRGSKILKLAVNKNGLSNFSFIILELFPEIVTKENNKYLLDREDFYLKYLLPNYNILTEAGSSFGYKHTDIDRKKMSENFSMERRNRIGDLNKDQSLKEETKEKMRIAALNRIPRIFSEESMLNMKKSSKKITVLNKDRTIYGVYLSMTEAAKQLNCNEKTIRRALKSKSQILKRKYIVALTDSV